MKRKLAAALILLSGLSVFFTLSSSAYVDPTTTTFLFQALAGVVAVVGTAIVIFWRRAKRKVSKMLGIDENKNMEVEDEFTVVGETDAAQAEKTDEPSADGETEPQKEKKETEETEEEEIDFNTVDE
ncbi:MAG: hypothetical protein J6Z04_02435 [Clostridia bacterium]|nr:hypothetical protein [Clostridia bacterium]